MTENELLIHDLKRDVESLQVDLKRETSMNDVLLKLPGLYYNYKRRTNEEIFKYLDKVKIVKAQHKGIGTQFGYYPLDEEAMNKIFKSPRGKSLSFDATTTSDEPMLELKEYKKLYYLVKSSSRFFLKPDIGEIIDQIKFDDYHSSEIKAIVFDPDSYQVIEGTQGEHFVMIATLLVDANSKIKCE